MPVAYFLPPLSAAFWLIEPSVAEPLLRAVIRGSLSFKAARRNSRWCSHAPPVIVFGLDGSMRKREKPRCRPSSLECPFTRNVAIEDSGTSPLSLNLSFECSFLNKLTSTMCASFSVRMMVVPKNDKYKNYARYAAHCLNMMASTRDEDLRAFNAKWPPNG